MENVYWVKQKIVTVSNMRVSFNIIDKAPVDKSVIQQIKQSFKMIKYVAADVIVFKLESFDKPITYNGEIYIREGNDIKYIKGTKDTIAYCKRVFNTTDLI